MTTATTGADSTSYGYTGEQVDSTGLLNVERSDIVHFEKTVKPIERMYTKPSQDMV